jgi:FkbM family methyltransferase
VGANVGIYSYALHRLGFRVHAFEPQPACAQVLAAWAKGKSELTVHNAAAGSTTGYLTLHVPILSGRPVPTRASFLPSSAETLSMQVPVLTLDSFNLQPVSFIKIDVEGYECDVLRGASSLLDAFHPILLIEIDRSMYALEKFVTLIDMLRSKGYRSHTVCDNGRLKECADPWAEPAHIYNFIFSRHPLD